MTKLTYKWTKANDTKIFTSFADAEEYIKFNGGRFTPTYETIYNDTEYTGTRTRRTI